jgi:hypothetical protein
VRRLSLLLVLSSVSYAQYTVTTVAGGAPATFQFGAIVRDASGNTYVCGGAIAARIDPAGKVAPYAGTGVAGYSGDGGPALNAQLNGNGSCAINPNGNLIAADSNNARIRSIDRSGNITTIVGTGISGDLGDGWPGSSAQVGFILGLAVDPSGAIYFSDEAPSIRFWYLPPRVNDARITKQSIMDMFYRNVILVQVGHEVSAPFWRGAERTEARSHE